MRALSHAGNYVGRRLRGDRLVGASVAFLGAPPGQALHSHVTGATAGGRASGSRSSCTSAPGRWPAAWRGSPGPTTRWSAATPTSTWPNSAPARRSTCPTFYGAMDDAINAGDESDRVLAVWPLTAPRRRGRRPAASRTWPRGAARTPWTACGRRAGRAGPVAGPYRRRRSCWSRCPSDIEALRAEDAGAAATGVAARGAGRAGRPAGQAAREVDRFRRQDGCYVL